MTRNAMCEDPGSGAGPPAGADGAVSAESLGPDHLFIVDSVPEGARVLDLGCGTGALLKMLADRKGTRGTGIEIVEERVYEAAAHGVTVHHGDFTEVLPYYPDASFDYVVLSQTLQQADNSLTVLNEALRVGRYVVASFPNFGHWKARLQLLFTGRVPVTKALPYEWYDTPNLRSLTIRDFRSFTCQQGMRIVRCFYMGERGRIRLWPNLRAVDAVFVVERVAATAGGGAVECGSSRAHSSVG
jgi:methionine biosynthesis protein MetW